jgi:peroxiredoxin
LIRIEPDLLELGYQIIAISADSPATLNQSQQKHKPNYLLLSDDSMKGAMALGIAWKVDDAMMKKLGGFGIDIEKASGETHRILPVPAAYVVGTDGTIKFAYINPDHRVRVPSTVLLAAAKEALK